jgi:heme oxygenase (mycobilin-producing)
VLVVSRFTVAEGEAESFLARAKDALAVLAASRGYRAGRIGRSVDDPSAWVLTTEWDGVGACRRALSSYEAKLRVQPLLGEAHAGPTTFEIRYAVDAGAAPVEHPGGLAGDAQTAGPGDRPLG